MFILLVIGRVSKEKNKQLLMMFCAILVLFILISTKSEKDKVSSHSAGNSLIHITFKEVPIIDGNRLRAIVADSNQEKLLFTYTIQSEGEKSGLESKLRAGVSCLIAGEFVLPENNRNENAFNYKQYLFRQNIHWIFEATEISLDKCQFSSNSVNALLRNIRADGIKKIEENFPATIIPYANALIFGDRSAFSEDAYRGYQKIGVVHLLAISGLHIGFLVGSIYFLLLRSGMTKETIFLLLIFLLPIYAVISGGNPPVVRAVIMTLILLASRKWRLPLTTLDACSVSFILFLFFDPFLIYHAGFQLSYCVSFGLILSSGSSLGRNKSYIRQMANISIISTLASFPILTYHFYEFSIISIIANIIFVPFYTAIVLPAMLILFIMQLAQFPFFQLLAEWVSKLIFFSEEIAKITGSLKFSTLITGKPGTVSLIFMIAGAFLYLLLHERGKSHPYAAMPLIFVLLCHFAAFNFSPKGEVVFIDVGQGDSILIKLPLNRGTYLIDTGGQIDFPVADWEKRKNPFRVGSDILLPFLKSKGINKIDKLILTHSDIDHIGGAHDLLGEIAIGEIFIPPNAWVKPVMAEFISSAKQLGLNVREEKAGIGWENKTGSFQIIFPYDDEYKDNNSSLVLSGEFGGLTWLFTGDVEKRRRRGNRTSLRKYSRKCIKSGSSWKPRFNIRGVSYGSEPTYCHHFSRKE